MHGSVEQTITNPEMAFQQADKGTSVLMSSRVDTIASIRGDGTNPDILSSHDVESRLDWLFNV
jgi:hypothetical protein